VIAVGALLAAAVLIVAEFTSLYSVRVIGEVAPVKTVATGSHHGYALIPIAVLVAVLAVAAWRGAGRPALLALGALAAITLVIALLIDLPDANRTGLVATGARFELGSSTPGVGFYLETLGAVLLLIASGVGLLARTGEGGARPARPRTRLR
jgi:NADH:ubiquinone oxidoreductase subunit 5 (subunit L)/multisubunit Na+/H+ antiporter MnhA subunit